MDAADRRTRLSDQLLNDISSARRRNWLRAHAVMLVVAIVACSGYIAAVYGYAPPRGIRQSVDNLAIAAVIGFFFGFPLFVLIEGISRRRRPIEWNPSQETFVSVAKILCTIAWLLFSALLFFLILIARAGGFD